MALEHFDKQKFDNNMRQLAGSPDRALLPGLFTPYPTEADSGHIDSVDTGEGTITDYTDLNIGTDTLTPLRNKKTRKALEADIADNAANDTFANWQALLTPYNEIARYRTNYSLRLNEWGHTFDEDVDLRELMDPKHYTLKQGHRVMHRRDDAFGLLALLAPTVSRKKFEESAANDVAFPASQKVTLTTAGAVFDSSAFDDIREKFMQNYANSEEVFVAINPTHQKQLMQENGMKVVAREFVTPKGYYERGELPMIQGCHVIVHPLVPLNKVVAWQREGVMWIPSKKGLQVDLSKEVNLRCATVLYMRKKVDAVRIDDKRVVWVDIVAAT